MLLPADLASFRGVGLGVRVLFHNNSQITEKVVNINESRR